MFLINIGIYRISVAAKKSTPAPMHTECTAANTGFAHNSNELTDAWHSLIWRPIICARRAKSLTSANCALSSIAVPRSRPLVNTLPRPDKTMARQSASTLSCSKHCRMSDHMRMFSAFILSGRFSWTWNTKGRGRSTSSVS